MMAPLFFWILLSVLGIATAARVTVRRPATRRLHRLLVVILLILPFPGVAPRGMSGRRDVEHVLIVDISRSMGSHPSSLVTEALEQYASAVGKEDVVVVAMGRTPHVLESGNEVVEATDLNNLNDRGSADLTAAIAAGCSELNDGAPLHLSLFTDLGLGVQDVSRVTQSLVGRSVVELVILDPAAPKTEDVSVRFKTQPISCRPGETPVCELEVFGRVLSSRVFQLELDGKRREVTLTPRMSSISVALPTLPMDTGRTRIQARLIGHEDWDADAIGDTATLPCHVQRASLHVALVSDRARPGLVAGLKSAGVAVTVSELPPSMDGQDVIICENQTASNVGDQGARRLEQFVRGGGGLFLAGASHAFGKGGWSSTPLDMISPLRSRPDRRRLHVTLLLDRSGSMEREGRLDAARHATRALCRHLSHRDTLDVMAFGAGQETRRFQGGDDSALAEWLATLFPSGGTDLVSAVDSALSAPQDSDSEQLLLILTDWQDPAATAAVKLSAWREQAQSARRTLSIFWFDRDEQRRVALDTLAVGTGGSLVDIDDFAALLSPMIRVVDESLVLAPASVESLGSGRGTLTALLRTSAKEGVRVLAQHNAGTAALASWHLGDGQVAASPMDLDRDNVAALFGDHESMAGILGGLSVGGSHLNDSVSLERGTAGWRFRVSAEGDLSRLSTNSTSFALRRTSPTKWVSTWIDAPPAWGHAVLYGKSEAPRSVRPYVGSDPFDRLLVPGAMEAAALRQMIAGDAVQDESGGVPTFLLILALLACIGELASTLFGR